MTQVAPSLLDHDELIVAPPMDTAELLHQLSKRDQRRHKPECGLAWFVQHTRGEYEPCLTIGVRGAVGALMWHTATQEFFPAHGTNVDVVDYFLPDGHLVAMMPSTELPIEQVHAAIREYVRTGQRPMCLAWDEQA